MWCDGGKWTANEILEFLTANLPCKVDKDPRLTAMLSIASQISRRNNNFAIQWNSLLFSVPRFKSLYRLGWFYPQCKCQLDKNDFAALRKNQPPFHERRKHPASATQTLRKRGNVKQNTPQKRAGEGQVTFSAENQTSENFLSFYMWNHMERRTFATTSEKHGEQDWIFLHYERNNNMIKSRWPLYQFVLTMCVCLLPS